MRFSFKAAFDPDDLRRKLEAAALKSVRKQVEQRVRSARCPVHGIGATTVSFGGGHRNLGIQLRSCCEQGLKAAQATLPLKRSV